MIVARRRTGPGRRVRAASPVAVVLATAFAVGGCGVIGGPGSGDIADAARRTADTGTARIAMTTVVDGGVGEPVQRIDAGGLVDFSLSAMELELLVGPLVTGGGPVAADGGNALRLVSDGPTTVMRLAAWPSERPWALVPSSEQVQAADVGGRLELLSRGIVDIDEVGRADVRGESSRHLVAAVDLDRGLNRTTDDAGREVLEALIDQAGSELELEVWIGDDALVRRMGYTIDLSASAVGAPDDDLPGGTSLPGVGQGATLTTVVEYYDFGVPFAVELPEDVVDAAAAD